MAKNTRKIALVVIGLIACLAIACLTDNAIYLRTPLKSIDANRGENGLWLRYFWYAGKHKSENDWQAMLKRLRDFQIRYAYFHVMTTKSDGSLKIHRKENALKITSRVHREAPQSKPIAWVYVGAAPQPDGSNLEDSAVRKTLVNEALWLVNDCDFDGVQWDYEFCTNGNEGLLKLIDETRAALPKNKIISVDTPMYYPCTLWGWSDEYFKKVAAKSDQICVMSYDSYLYWARAYAWLVAQQVEHVSNDAFIANKDCKVIFGVPTYEDKTTAHNCWIESFANSLRGLRNGYDSPDTQKESIAGVALFADYTTDENEWKDYNRIWIGRNKTTF